VIGGLFHISGTSRPRTRQGQLGCCFIARKMFADFEDLAQLHGRTLDRVNDPSETASPRGSKIRDFWLLAPGSTN
jgi:hypothetical protein